MDQNLYWRRLMLALFQEVPLFYVLAIINGLTQLILFLGFALLLVYHWPAPNVELVYGFLFTSGDILLLIMYYIVFRMLQQFFDWFIIVCVQRYFERKRFEFKWASVQTINQVDRIVLWSLLSTTVGNLVDLIQRTRFINVLTNILIPVAWRQLSVFAAPAMSYNDDQSIVKAMSDSRRHVRRAWGEQPDIRFPLRALNKASLVMAFVPLGATIMMNESDLILIGTTISLFIVMILTIIDHWSHSFISAVAFRFSQLYSEQLARSRPMEARLFLSEQAMQQNQQPLYLEHDDSQPSSDAGEVVETVESVDQRSEHKE